MQTLVLNASYEVLKIVSWKRALVWYFLDKVEIIEEYDREVRTPNLKIRVPAVVRFLKMVKTKFKSIKFNRTHIHARDNWTCQYCSKKMNVGDLTIDHVLPRSRGGKTSWNNCVSSCLPCNLKKADRLPTEANMVLNSEPTQPKPNEFLSLIIKMKQNNIPELWKNYFGYLRI